MAYPNPAFVKKGVLYGPTDTEYCGTMITFPAPIPAGTYSVVDRITRNLVASLNGITLNYGNSDKVLYAEQQRMFFDPQSQPYLEVCGPWENVISGGGARNRIDNTTIMYRLCFSDYVADANKNDEEITKVYGSVLAQIQRAIMIDITRGGLALITRKTGEGYLLLDDPAPDIVMYLDIEVHAFIDSDDPYVSRC